MQAGIFGGSSKIMLHVSKEMLSILEKDMIEKGVIDNEQCGFAVLYKRNPEIFRVLLEKKDFQDRSCNFICI